MSDLKLTIELIPKTAWFKNLRNHVGQRKWDMIRGKCYQEANHRCEICGGTGNKWPVECHERWKFEDGNIILEGFIALCPPCHEVKHMGLAQVRGRLEQAANHFKNVNDLSDDEAFYHIDKAFKLYHKRSKESWELCLDAVDDYLE